MIKVTQLQVELHYTIPQFIISSEHQHTLEKAILEALAIKDTNYKG